MSPINPPLTSIPIPTLSPSLPNLPSLSVHGIVILLWPYSSSTRSCALLLSSPDYRQRNRKGQVRVQFHGVSARTVAEQRIGIGDAVTLGLEGVEWVEVGEGNGSTPGKSVDWEMRFTKRLCLRAEEGNKFEGSGKVVDVRSESPDPEDVSVVDGREDTNGYSSLANGDAAMRTPMVKRNGIMHTPGTWASPAFLRQSRGSKAGLVDLTYDPFTDGDETENGEGRARKRRKTWQETMNWKFADNPPSPSKGGDRKDVEDWDIDGEDDLENEERASPKTPAEKATQAESELPNIADTATTDVRDFAIDQSVNQARQRRQGTPPRAAIQIGQSPQRTPPVVPKISIPSPSEIHTPVRPSVAPGLMMPPAIPGLSTDQASSPGPDSTEDEKPRTPQLTAIPSPSLPLPSPFPAESTARNPFFSDSNSQGFLPSPVTNEGANFGRPGTPELRAVPSWELPLPSPFPSNSQGQGTHFFEGTTTQPAFQTSPKALPHALPAQRTLESIGDPPKDHTWKQDDPIRFSDPIEPHEESNFVQTSEPATEDILDSMLVEPSNAHMSETGANIPPSSPYKLTDPEIQSEQLDNTENETPVAEHERRSPDASSEAMVSPTASTPAEDGGPETPGSQARGATPSSAIEISSEEESDLSDSSDNGMGIEGDEEPEQSEELGVDESISTDQESQMHLQYPGFETDEQMDSSEYASGGDQEPLLPQADVPKSADDYQYSSPPHQAALTISSNAYPEASEIPSTGAGIVEQDQLLSLLASDDFPSGNDTQEPTGQLPSNLEATAISPPPVRRRSRSEKTEETNAIPNTFREISETMRDVPETHEDIPETMQDHYQDASEVERQIEEDKSSNNDTSISAIAPPTQETTIIDLGSSSEIEEDQDEDTPRAAQLERPVSPPEAQYDPRNRPQELQSHPLTPDASQQTDSVLLPILGDGSLNQASTRALPPTPQLTQPSREISHLTSTPSFEAPSAENKTRSPPSATPNANSQNSQDVLPDAVYPPRSSERTSERTIRQPSVTPEPTAPSISQSTSPSQQTPTRRSTRLSTATPQPKEALPAGPHATPAISQKLPTRSNLPSTPKPRIKPTESSQPASTAPIAVVRTPSRRSARISTSPRATMHPSSTAPSTTAVHEPTVKSRSPARRSARVREQVAPSRPSEVPSVSNPWFGPRKSESKPSPRGQRRMRSTTTESGTIETELFVPDSEETGTSITTSSPPSIAKGHSVKEEANGEREETPKATPTPKKRGRPKREVTSSPIQASQFSLRGSSQKGTRTQHAYYTPLSSLANLLNSDPSATPDILAVAIMDSKTPERAKAGPKDYFTSFKIVDPSLGPADKGTEVRCFRPYKAALPIVNRGDAVLLRAFTVVGRKGKTDLVSGEGSGWCVWRFGEKENGGGMGTRRSPRKLREKSASQASQSSQDRGGPVWAKRQSKSGFKSFARMDSEDEEDVKDGVGDVREEMRGPPVEFGKQEREIVRGLRGWWEKSGRDGEVKAEVKDEVLGEHELRDGLVYEDKAKVKGEVKEKKLDKHELRDGLVYSARI
ncbi:MAG: hypothetical protein M1820_008960 [Bogoriella megaspora]|nr:MAG: hypothetical protein M1820_008960 [Bogoriella megaspora]